MKLFSTFFFCLFFVKVLFAAPEKPTLFEYFQSSEIIDVTIETNMKTLIRKKFSSNWIPGNLSWENKKGVEENWDIEIRTRGNMRKEICYFPPLKLKFTKSDKKEIGVKGSRRIKLVSACKGSKKMEQYVLQEHLLYKMYNRITPESFRVQLVRFTFIDIGNNRSAREDFGFFIEDVEDVAKRLGGKELEPKIMSPAGVQKSSLDKMTIFQYAIGNTDWYIYNHHNLKYISSEGASLAKVIPYDFDYAGIIHTGYAAPGEGIPIASVRQRIYIGACRTDEEWDQNLKPFREAKNDWIQLIETDSFLNKSSKKKMLRFLKKFFCIIENEKKTRRRMKRHCDVLLQRRP